MAVDPIRQPHLLHPHVSNSSRVAIESRLALNAGGRLSFSYVLTGDLSRLRIPPPSSLRRGQRLWQHTCFEAFIAIAETPAYYEYNFSPSREWAAFGFRTYRDGNALTDDCLAPEIVPSRQDGRLELSATIRWDRLLLIEAGMTVRVGLAAVIEEIDGILSYWALKHPADEPDFHHPDSFALEFVLPGPSV